MNKAEFLAGLRDALAGKLPSGELEDVLSYYEAVSYTHLLRRYGRGPVLLRLRRALL